MRISHALAFFLFTGSATIAFADAPDEFPKHKIPASADGNQFPWIFNAPATYWDGASVFIRHVADVEVGADPASKFPRGSRSRVPPDPRR